MDHLLSKVYKAVAILSRRNRYKGL